MTLVSLTAGRTQAFQLFALIGPRRHPGMQTEPGSKQRQEIAGAEVLKLIH
jgi:hypothetical protein